MWTSAVSAALLPVPDVREETREDTRDVREDCCAGGCGVCENVCDPGEDVRDACRDVCDFGEADPHPASTSVRTATTTAAGASALWAPTTSRWARRRRCGDMRLTVQHTGELSIEAESEDMTLYASQTPANIFVVFDLGGVLLDWNPRYLYRRLMDDEAEMERFLGEVCTLEWHAAHDRGVPMAESCAALAAAHPEYAELINAWSERSEEMIAGPIHGTVAILEELLQKGVRCYALTNMERETYPLRRQRYPFMGWFAGTIVSSYEGVAKPDPEIFLRLLDRFGLVPERTIMIDDSPPNIDTAASLGMKAVRFTSPAALRAALNGLGLTSYPSGRERY